MAHVFKNLERRAFASAGKTRDNAHLHIHAGNGRVSIRLCVKGGICGGYLRGILHDIRLFGVRSPFAAGVVRHRLLTDVAKSAPRSSPCEGHCAATGRGVRLNGGELLPARPLIMNDYNTGSMRA